MLYGLSRNLCQNSAKIQFLCHSMLFGNLGMHASAPRNCCCCLFSSARPLSCSLLFSQQEFFSSSLVLSTRLLFLQLLSCSLNKTSVFLPLALGISPKSLLASHQDFFNFLFLASHQEPLGISPRVSFLLLLLSLVLSTRMLQLSCSWHLTKNLLASHQESLASTTSFALGISPRASWHLTKILLLLTQEWVRPLALINLMREGEEFSNLTVEIRSDGWLRFGVSSLTLTLIIKLSFNLHLTN
jgi:hypothetical protein